MDTPIELKTFEFHGLDIASVNGSQQVETDCPFCNKPKHFFVSAKKGNVGQFSCKKCGAKGNRFTFLQLFYEQCLQETKDSHYRELAKKRSTNFWQAFRDDNWAWDSDRKRWLIPVYNADWSIVNLQAYIHGNTPSTLNTTGCSQHLHGLEQLTKEGPIIICEGRSDAVMMRHIWSMVDDRPSSILAVPGIDLLPSCLKKDIKHNEFANRDLILLYDSGERSAKCQQDAAAILSREYHARSVLCLHWPDSYPDNFDITDLINSKGKEDAWAKIQSWLRPYGRKSTSDTSAKKLSLDGVIREFRESKVHVNQGFADAITTVLATVASIQFGGIPLWLYLVDPPGYGKSLILESTIKSPICHFQTDLAYTTLVSGYNAGGNDPSLLARINNRVLVVKDYTAILDKNEVAQRELLGILRDAYDGEVVREYGNGVTRIYPDPASGLDRCYFGLICGVTPKIHIYNKAALGERFLKCSIGRPPISSTEIYRRAVEGADQPWLEVQNAIRRQEAVASFFEAIDVKEPPSIRKHTDTIIALAQFVAVCRTRPERCRQTGDLLYEAASESASRLCKQLTKLSQSLAAIRGIKTIDDEVIRLVRKVAWVSSYGWHRDIYRSLWSLGSGAKKPTSQEVAVHARKSLSSTQRVIADLRDLGVCERGGRRSPTSNGGRPADQWKLTAHGRDLIEKSGIFA